MSGQKIGRPIVHTRYAVADASIAFIAAASLTFPKL
jgi:hypothetical protein